MSFAVRQDETGVRFAVVVSPRKSRDALGGVHDGALKLSLRAAPVEGAANRALCALLAKRLGVHQHAVTVVAGNHSRRKTVKVVGITAEAAAALAEGEA